MQAARLESWTERLTSGEDNSWLVYEMCKTLRETKGAEFRTMGPVQKIKLLQDLLPGVSPKLITEGYAEYEGSGRDSIPADIEIMAMIQQAN